MPKQGEKCPEFFKVPLGEEIEPKILDIKLGDSVEKIIQKSHQENWRMATVNYEKGRWDLTQRLIEDITSGMLENVGEVIDMLNDEEKRIKGRFGVS